MTLEQKKEEARQSLAEAEKRVDQTTDPNLKRILARFLERAKSPDIACDLEEFKNEIIKNPKRPEQLVFSFLPHQMAKTSIFFPMSDRELKEENRKITKIEHQTGWGKIVIEGIKLAIFEEDIFLALMKIAKDNATNIGPDSSLKTSMNEIIHLLYGRSGYTKKSSERIEKTLQHFQLVRFELTTYNWKKKGKERIKTETVRSIGNIVQSYKYNKKTKDLIIYFNPQFFAYFLESMLTNINFTIRRQLKKDGSKALLRFLSTHTKPNRMHIVTVLNAINFNTNQPLYTLRYSFKNFLRELKKNKILGKKTKLYKDDTVFFDILSSPKPLPD